MAEQVAISGGVVSFSECVGAPGLSRTIQASRKTRSETRIGLISWASIDSLLAECFPPAPALPGVHPSVSYLYCQEVEIRPYPPMPAQSDLTCLTTNVNYTSGICTIKYAPLDYDANDLINRRASVSIDVMVLPANATMWEDLLPGGEFDLATATDEAKKAARPEAEDIVAGKQIPMTDWQFNYQNVPPAKEATLDAAVRNLIGFVNEGTYDGKESETLLFKGFDKTWSIDSNGEQKFTYGYQFMERRVKDGSATYGWNHFYRNKDGAWAVLLQKDGKPIYPQSPNFGDLFV